MGRDKEKYKEWRRNWVLKNWDYVKEYHRQYYQEHKEQDELDAKSLMIRTEPLKTRRWSNMYNAKKYRKEEEEITKLWRLYGWFIMPDEKTIDEIIEKEKLLDEDTIDDVSLEDCIENEDEDIKNNEEDD